MRSSALLAISLLANVVLAVILTFVRRQPAAPPQVAPPNLHGLVRTQKVVKPVRIIQTNVLRESFSWQQIESADYPTYIANLRSVGCPEATIRDLIVADVNHLYAQKRSGEVVSPSKDQWWRTEPDMDALESAANRLETLDRERRTLLTQLLGPNWEQTDVPERRRGSGRGLAMSGPVLSKLSAETEQAVQNSWQRMRQAYDNHVASRKLTGQAEDPAEVARLRRDLRSELERTLTAEQLEEFLLRYSHVSQQMRKQLQGCNVTAEEFRTLFRVRDALEQQLPPSDWGPGDAGTRRRAEIDRQTEAAVQQTLGLDRYHQYKSNIEPVFREARSIAQAVGAPPDAIQPFFEIHRVVKAEESRIKNDTNLTDEQRTAQLEEARQAQKTALRQLLGEEAYKRWEETYGRPK